MEVALAVLHAETARPVIVCEAKTVVEGADPAFFEEDLDDLISSF